MTNPFSIQSSPLDYLLFSNSDSGKAFQPEFEQLIDENSDEAYLDPSRHDLTQDRRDPDEEWNRRKRRVLFCFHCNRPESHAPAVRHRWQYSFLIGLTLGLVKFIGPYFCRCCGHRRLMAWNSLNPRYWLIQHRLRRSTSRRRSKRR